MSIFTKITLLFSISLLLMIGIGYKMDAINTQKYESIILQKYKIDGHKIFGWMATASADTLKNKLKTLNLVTIAPVSAKRVVLNQPHTFGVLEIFEARNGDYVLHVRYIDEELYLRDTTLQEAQKEGWVLNALVIADIVVLGVIFIIIVRMLSPLNAIAASMRRFMLGEYRTRSELDSRDEIGEVARSYNEMAQTIENLIRSREELLRDVGHELRTPITRGLFALEQIEASTARDALQHSFKELDELTRELLEIEKLQATGLINSEAFTAETLVMEALSKLCLADESAIAVTIHTNVMLEGDLLYLSMALKNLLDNGLKYADRLPIRLEVVSDRISVLNHGKPLEKEFDYFLTPFTRQESSRTTQGFGLGLSLVAKIVAKHGFLLTHEYEKGTHCFSIIFGSTK